jgi:fatty-acyl-CoA synthase
LPAPHVAVRLVADGGDVRPGAIGEVWLKGPSVSPGYWQRPAETAAAFNNGWYRTGDLGRRDARGFFHIVDRLKDMYVSGGENVYPAEVEAVLAAQRGVADVAVVGVTDPRWGETGVAFVVAALGGTPPDSAALLAACVARLAKYKCPSRIVLVDAIPRTAAGKVLKIELRRRLNSGEFR